MAGWRLAEEHLDRADGGSSLFDRVTSPSYSFSSGRTSRRHSAILVGAPASFVHLSLAVASLPAPVSLDPFFLSLRPLSFFHPLASPPHSTPTAATAAATAVAAAAPPPPPSFSAPRRAAALSRFSYFLFSSDPCRYLTAGERKIQLETRPSVLQANRRALVSRPRLTNRSERSPNCWLL